MERPPEVKAAAPAARATIQSMLLSEIAGCLRDLGRQDKKIERRCSRIADQVDALAALPPRQQRKC